MEMYTQINIREIEIKLQKRKLLIKYRVKQFHVGILRIKHIL